MYVSQKNAGDLFAEQETALIVSVPVVHMAFGGTGELLKSLLCGTVTCYYSVIALLVNPKQGIISLTLLSDLHFCPYIA